jgi:serine/threonine-protein kinase
MEPAMLFLGRMRISPDGRKVALGISDSENGTDNLWLYDTMQHQTTRLTFERLVAQGPVWSPDSATILYTTNHFGAPQIFSISAAGVGDAERFVDSDQSDLAESWSNDGRYVIFRRAPVDKMAQSSLWVLPLFGDRKPYPLIPARHGDQWDATFSPDGKWLSYVSDDSGEEQVYVSPFPDAHQKSQVSNQPGSRPQWSPDGHKLYYVGKDHRVLAITLRFTANGVEVVDAKSLFKVEIPDFQLSKDGKRFLIFKITENQEPSTLTVINNWPNALSK